MKRCLSCGKILRNAHANRKRCETCAQALVKRPRSTLTAAQVNQVRAWNGSMPVVDMAERLNTSVSNIKRAFIGTGERLWFKNGKYKNQPELVREVMSYYARNGKTATVDAFPGVNVKCIIDRPEYYGVEKPRRQTRWTNYEIHEAAKMAGLVSHSSQAKFFNRPNASNGSIKALWVKRFGLMGGSINGMAFDNAKHLVDSSAQFIHPVSESRLGQRIAFRWLILWVEMERCLVPDVPPFIREAVKTMANFQRWLWRTKNPKPKILRMMQEREI